MTSFSMVRTGLLASLGIALLGGCSDDEPCGPVAAEKTFTVTLTKAAEIPPCSAAGANATGSAIVTVSADACEVEVSNFTVSGLSGAVGLVRVSYGAPGVAGPTVLRFSGTASPINQTFTSSDYLAATGAPATFADFITQLRAGGAAYIVAHTAACSNGEIRGEIQ